VCNTELRLDDEIHKVIWYRLQKNESFISISGFAETNFNDIPNGLLGKASMLNRCVGNMKTNRVGIRIGATRRFYPNTDNMVCFRKAKC
jgi:hypothetical protein